MDLIERYKGCLLGLAVGDAVGTTLEFKPRGTFQPIEDMIGGGPFNLKPGQWTDDTSMALCLATSLIESNGFNAKDQMDRYCSWQDNGYLTSTGTCFDIGNTVSSALRKYRQTGNPYSGSTDPHSAGNGSIMRLAPIPMFFLSDMYDVERFATQSSRATHGAEEAIDACRLLARIIARALNGKSKEEILFGDANSILASPKILDIADGIYKEKQEVDIRGTGYVVESLEASMYCFYKTNNFKDAILKAANLGDDADTTAAITGQVAGAYYGISEIPNHWLSKLSMRDEITDLADNLYKLTSSIS